MTARDLARQQVGIDAPEAVAERDRDAHIYIVDDLSDDLSDDSSRARTTAWRRVWTSRLPSNAVERPDS